MKLAKLFLVVVSTTLIGNAFAGNAIQCPRPIVIKNTYLNNAHPHEDKWAVSEYNNFGTPEMWGFGFANINASSAADAASQANSALDSLTFNSGPFASTRLGVTVCYYDSAAGFQGIALTLMS